ncbi:hypothetical protein [Streptomyces meridianus]|uniref:Integral membrane protein n=1 Tax=Streptomyces meridianus TaxID=2938945 RepID=A0ABT0X2W5_9ACTN|nr:hypothetical protein [Streptomyces meridianus]MCM2576863.1 hypothetical protein [Streptomyces meridianus]
MSDTPARRATATADDARDARAGDGLVRAGGIVFLVGALATLATITPLFIGADPLPTAAYAVSMLMGAGFAIAGAGVLRSIAVQRRQARSAATGSRPAA